MKPRWRAPISHQTLLPGWDNSHFFRDLGIIAYGFEPTVVPSEVDGTIHGNDERVPVESIRKGVRHLLEILEIIVY